MKISIPMRDGRELAADRWLPAQEYRGPVLLVQTPYNRRVWKPQVCADYAWVVVDWRGYYGSKGARTDSWHRGEDGYDCVEWVAAQPWCDGRVGTWGQSALGRAQFWTAAERPPHLVCCAVLVSSISDRYGMYYWGGVLRKEYQDVLERLGFPTAKLAREHPTHDEAWKRIESRPSAETIDVPILMIGGWYDLFTEGVLETYERLEREDRWLIVGPWHHHEVNKAAFARSETERFFHYYMLGEANDWPSTPRFRWQPIGSTEWHSRKTFLPGRNVLRKKILPGTIFLRHDPAHPVPTVGGANLDPKLRLGPQDQRRILDKCVAREVEWTGEILGRPKIVCDVSGPFDLHVRLCDVRGDEWILIADGVRRTDGGPTEVILPPIAATLRKVGLLFSGSNFPRYELRPEPAEATLEGVVLELPEQVS